MKKIGIFTLGIALLLCMSTYNVYASKSYYTNTFGVSLTKEEYEFLTKMYWDGYQSLMTVSDYQEFQDSKVMDGEIDFKEIKSNEEPITRATSFSSGSKTLKIFKSCTSDCTISVTLTWDSQPTVRSYDVIGSYLDGTTLKNTPSTTIVTSGVSQVVNDLKTANNGIGSSFMIPFGSNIVINQIYRVAKQGHVYASYQHATIASTLAKSKDYTFSKSGYGKVFNFSAGSRNIYDGMNGVDIAL